eukprot:CAMPEP_0172786804 /NCGR_PEP_ID=MMETSP1074-20121228/206132_1 /TAXON_ID=2916 /ORGANISM="Ceratium fusus, Strain PA161109" /LENGTH=187 /DNA_ID=CAMNT_0013623819 /DNA_START=158 /DNA_END=721 /DNA_ORIENTATION=+
MVVPIAPDDEAAARGARVRACSAITAIRAKNFLFNSGLHSMDGGIAIVSALQEKGSAIICSEILLTCFLYLSLLPLHGRTLDFPSAAVLKSCSHASCTCPFCLCMVAPWTFLQQLAAVQRCLNQRKYANRGPCGNRDIVSHQHMVARKFCIGKVCICQTYAVWNQLMLTALVSHEANLKLMRHHHNP